MSKKKTEEVKPVITTNETALARPEVSNSINLNMNQNDVIDIAIQEQLGILEVQIKANDALVKQKKEAFVQLQSDLLGEYAKKTAMKQKGYQKFTELVEAGKLRVTRHVNEDEDPDIDEDENGNLILPTNFAYASNYASKNVGKYRDYNFNDQYRDYKNPVNHAKKCVQERHVEIRIPKEVRMSVQAGDNHGFQMTWQSQDIPTTVEFREDFEKKMTPAAIEYAEAMDRSYELNLQYLEYENGDKKIKALVLKKSLSKSEEGRGILKMLQDATNIKMLG